MKATELRIGNLVRSQNTPIPCRVVTLHKHVAVVIQNTINSFEETCNYVDVSAIPLTEEWLFKFGFKDVSEHKNHETIKSLKLIASNDSLIIVQFRPEEEALLWLSITDCDHEGSVLTSIDKVHQFQNLYFALTGKELELVK